MWVPNAASNTGAFNVITASETPAERAAALMPQTPTAAPGPESVTTTRTPINIAAATPVAVSRLSSFLTNAGGR